MATEPHTVSFTLRICRRLGTTDLYALRVFHAQASAIGPYSCYWRDEDGRPATAEEGRRT